VVGNWQVASELADLEMVMGMAAVGEKIQYQFDSYNLPAKKCWRLCQSTEVAVYLELK
jgi:hypothetical protein